MSESSSNNKRIAKNTLLLYFRMLLTMGVSLYTSRVVLRTLGVEDYGIYNVVGSFVAMFGVISGSLSSAVTRFLNIEMGRKNDEKLGLVFSSAITIHIILAFVIFLIAEILGPWFIVNKMTISLERLDAALWVFHCSVITFIINLISIPYNACIIAHENMKIFAYISVLEVILKLLLVYLLLLFSHDKLITYAILMLIVAVLIRLFYQIYCKRKYPECQYQFHFDVQQIKEMFGFASWNLIGSSSVILSNQGVNIILNIFCGSTVNAARGIAVQVDSAVNQFAQNFMVALNPQITKSYGAGDLLTYKKMMIYGSRFAMSLLTLLSVPVLIETEYILSLWLGEVPQYTVAFVKLMLIFVISESMSSTFVTGLFATGKIIKQQLFVGLCRMLNFPLTYIALLIWNIAELSVVIAIVISQVNLLIRLLLLKEHIDISLRGFYGKVVFKQLFVIVCSFMFGYILKEYMEEGLYRLFAVCILSFIINICMIFYIICTPQERQIIVTKIKEMKNAKRSK